MFGQFVEMNERMVWHEKNAPLGRKQCICGRSSCIRHEFVSIQTDIIINTNKRFVQFKAQQLEIASGRGHGKRRRSHSRHVCEHVKVSDVSVPWPQHAGKAIVLFLWLPLTQLSPGSLIQNLFLELIDEPLSLSFELCSRRQPRYFYKLTRQKAAHTETQPQQLRRNAQCIRNTMSPWPNGLLKNFTRSCQNRYG